MRLVSVFSWLRNDCCYLHLPRLPPACHRSALLCQEWLVWPALQEYDCKNFFFIFQTVLLTKPIWIPLWQCQYCIPGDIHLFYSGEPRVSTQELQQGLYKYSVLAQLIIMSSKQVGIMVGSDLINLSSKERRREWKRITSTNNQGLNVDSDANLHLKFQPFRIFLM